MFPSPPPPERDHRVDPKALGLAVMEVFRSIDVDAWRPNAIIEREVQRLIARVVLPVVRQAWPEVDRSPFLPKLTACVSSYTNLALSCIVCSRRRPWPFRLMSAASRLLRWREPSIARVATATTPLLFRWLEKERVERAALAAALIIVFDEVIDEGGSTDACSLLARRPSADPVGPSLAEKAGGRDVESNALAVVAAALWRRVRDVDDGRALERVVELFRAWAESERLSLAGAPDPEGLCHRRPAIVASMEILAWAIAPYAGDAETRWLVDLAELGQMVDDVLDMEKDAKNGRLTPALTGAWTVETVRRARASAEAQLVSLARAAGERDGAYLRLAVRTFRAQTRAAAEILFENP
jgi:hypothetical protein